MVVFFFTLNKLPFVFNFIRLTRNTIIIYWYIYGRGCESSLNKCFAKYNFTEILGSVIIVKEENVFT